MSVLKANIQSIVPKNQPFPPGAGSAAEAVTKAGGSASLELASALRNFDAWLNKIQKTLQNPQSISQLIVADSSGKVIAAVGDFIFQGVPATNYFSEIHVGDPLNTGDPAQALFNANPDGTVTVGENGSLDVLDPFGQDAAWIGTQSDVYDITGAVAGAVSGTVHLIRLTVTAHTLLTGDQVQVRGVVGVTSATDGTSNANGQWTVTKIDANHVDLQNSVFVGAYVSGGTISRLLHVTGAADNGSGLIRLTVTAHGYETGDKVDVLAVGGVPNAIGQWIITVPDANHFDLNASTFAGAYTSGGITLRYFAGGLFQTIAIGPSFANYNLRAFADGSLKIRNAFFSLAGSAGTITLDPSVPEFRAESIGGGYVSITPGVITVVSPVGFGYPRVIINEGSFQGFNSVLEESILLAIGGVGGDAGTLNLYNAGGTQHIFLDPSASSPINTTGDINTSGVYRKGGVSGLSTSVTLAKLTTLGANGSMTFSGGILTAYTAPT